jgi:hypothetical protein
MLIRLVDEHPRGAENLLSPGVLLAYLLERPHLFMGFKVGSLSLFKVIPERVHLEISYAALTDWRTRL